MNLKLSQLPRMAAFLLCGVVPGMALAGNDPYAASQAYPKTRQALLGQIHAAMRQNASGQRNRGGAGDTLVFGGAHGRPVLRYSGLQFERK